MKSIALRDERVALPRSETTFGAKIRTLASGTAAAQLLTIAVAPIMARLYTPEDFGVFAVWTVFNVVLVLLASGRYDAAILLPRDDAEGAELVCLVAALSATVTAAFTVFAVFGGGWLAGLLGVPALANWLVWLGPVVWVITLCQALGVWANRREAYPRLAACRLTQGIAQVATNIGLGILGAGMTGLVLGVVVGQLVGVGFLGWQFWWVDRARHPTMKWDCLVAAAKRHASFPLFTVWAELLNVLSNHLVALFLPRTFGVAALGWYSLGQRVIAVPTNVVGTAIGEVFRSNASRDYAVRGECASVYRQTLHYLLVASAVPFVLLAVVAPDLFAFVFGEPWRGAGQIARVMSLMYGLRFVAAPLAHTFFLARRQREDLALQIWLVVSSVGVLGVAYRWSGDVVLTLLAFSTNAAVVYGAYIARAHQLAKGAGDDGKRKNAES